MSKSYMQFLQLFFVVTDLLILNLSYLLAQGIFKESTESTYFLRYSQFWIIINGFWLISTWLGEVYAENNISYFDSFMEKTARIFVLWSFLILVYLFIPRVIKLSAPMVFTTVAVFFLGLLINRFIYLSLREVVKREVHFKRKILILGYNNLSRKLTSYLEKEGLDTKIVGYVDDKGSGPANGKYPVYKNLENTLQLSRELEVNEVYSTIMPENNHKVYNLMQEADQEVIRFRIVPDFSYLINRPVFVDYLHDIPILSVRREPLEEVINRFKKRVFDILVSTFVIVCILSWLFPLLALLIYLESPGPILFVQQRSGKDNKPFGCYKFRSMHVNKEANATQATKNDKRVTRIGKFIRKTSLDEFPQFLNVFKGQMSVVGPRPHMLKHTLDYSVLADDYMIRQFLKPGITGWAQVNGYRGEITELFHIKKRVEYDLWYLENWSLWLDLRIMFLTVYNVARGEENAY
jgi:putative colanic acid biosynthesis UDP-glucose lipid carrier transferase